MAEAPGPINFTMFLTMFGEKLNGTDPEDVIRNAFACFDDNNSGGQDVRWRLLTLSGKLSEEYLRELLMTTGDRYTEDQVDELLREAPIDANGDFDYIEVERAQAELSLTSSLVCQNPKTRQSGPRRE